MDDQGDQRALADALDRFSRKADDLLRVGRNTNQIVRVEGMGSMWNGIAIGIALGATILGSVWISKTLQAQEVTVNQAEAYSKAVYMLAPRFAQEIDKELDRQKEARREYADPDYHAPADRPDSAASEPPSAR